MRTNHKISARQAQWIAAVICAVLFSSVTFKALGAPPFVLLNSPDHEESTWIHSGNGYINQVVHPDLLYFPNGWGDVDGTSFKYWLGVTGYEFGNEKYEQPAILISNNLGNDTWEEPASNIFNTNPLSGWAWPVGSAGHFSDIDIVYNDDTDEIWAYVRNKDRNYVAAGDGREWIEIYKTTDGVTWDLVASHILEARDGGYLLSPSVIKEGNDWWMWLIDASSFSPNHLLRYHSVDGVNWTFDHDSGYSFRTGSERDPWHIDVVKYNDEYWGFLLECALDSSGSCNLTQIRSADGQVWSGYDSPILDINALSWDDSNIYRSSFIVEDGYLEGIYTARGSDGSWYAGYTSHSNVGGSGPSSNVVIPDAITVLSPNGGEELYAGLNHEITWATEGTIDFITIEYSINNGANWITLVENTTNDGAYPWVVPCNFSTTGLIRVSEPVGVASDTSDSVFSIIDNLPPSLSVSVSPELLWPPNHKMVLIFPIINVSDNCDANPDVTLSSITMNEGEETDTYEPFYDSTTGDGHTLNDIQVDDRGHIYLRAERSGSGNGRVYTITYTATDSSSNSAPPMNAVVTVPVNR